LINQGAKLVESAQDILEEMQIEPSDSVVANASGALPCSQADVAGYALQRGLRQPVWMNCKHVQLSIQQVCRRN
jgi:predicted Rossmann fold nucleotide-binding protein DprA/Smf involved in DNA uptake